MSICQTGPAFCLSPSGEELWSLSQEEVSHGQGIWPGDFLVDEPGQEVIVLRSGHSGEFVTVRGEDGSFVARFSHATAAIETYPDLPAVVRWTRTGQVLWVPADRVLVDGRGEVVQTLEPHDDDVVGLLHPGDTVATLPVQAFPVDLCGDGREELVLYHPYAGEAVLVFTQPGGSCEPAPYVHQQAAYNIRTYF
jgi:hypothetical protein